MDNYVLWCLSRFFHQHEGLQDCCFLCSSIEPLQILKQRQKCIVWGLKKKNNFGEEDEEEEDLASDDHLKPHEAMKLSSPLFCLKVHYLKLHSFLTSDICCCTDTATAFILQISEYGSVCRIVTIKFFFKPMCHFFLVLKMIYTQNNSANMLTSVVTVFFYVI
ncbi:hypothetical protein AMECASPLE_036728 [Ameca splendens]|uniref:Uncharacterized protein n=1 Tax=Ameca splendens TaxID=208324 RepID=A0ABV0YJ81_9TELE